jgi:hypothetical protein
VSNPVASIGNSIPEPGDPSLTRKTYTLVEFDAQTFYGYKVGEQPTFSPADRGESFFMMVPLYDALATTKPGFVTQKNWFDGGNPQNVAIFPSVFVSGAWNSIMPKILIPSDILVDNGLSTAAVPTTSAFFAWVWPDFLYDLFNWQIKTVNGAAVPAGDFYKYAQVGASFGSQYCVSKAKKDDSIATNQMVVELNNPSSPPTGDWDEDELVVGGAFVLMLNVTPLRPAGADPNLVQQNAWTVKIEFGEVTMLLDQTGALDIVISSGTSDDVHQKANLIEGKAKQGPPQQEHINDKQPYIIVVYPVWNGLVVSCGLSDASSSLPSTSQFVIKNRKASIKISPYSNWFNPQSPANVVVTAPADVLVDFGDKMTITANECRFDWCYLPCFFSRQGWFDEFFIVNDNMPGDVGYSFKIYSIYTLNATSYTVSETLSNTGVAGPTPDTHYMKDAWVMSYVAGAQPPYFFPRFGPQVFAAILETTETRQFPIKNGNGSFNIAFTPSSPADPSPTSSWHDYIQSISVTTGLDGSSGTITVDKFGIAGQEAAVTQSIGAVTITATGGYGTVPGSIFQGLGMGIAENLSPDGATWTVPLVGLEKKLDDIALINIPFFDGYPLSTVVDFLARYAGINYDLSNAPTAALVNLGISEDLNVPRFDWRTGTNVKTALDDVMKDTAFLYVVRDGMIYIYEEDDVTGLPVYLGPDRNPGGLTYPNTKVTVIDRTPDFEDLRNELVAVALQGVSAGQGTNFAATPMVPRIAALSLTTTPDVPWAKSGIDSLPGYLSESDLNTYLSRWARKARLYIISGKTTIPGNADIKPYDRWNGYVISSVTHNLDFQNKTWTTDLELYFYA